MLQEFDESLHSRTENLNVSSHFVREGYNYRYSSNS
jgi:hypothetical protein